MVVGTEVDATDVRENDCVRSRRRRLKRREAIVCKCFLHFFIEVRGARDSLGRSGLVDKVRCIKLGNAIDPDLLRGCTKRKRMTIPENDV